MTSRPDYSFTVPPLPIRFEIEGLEEGDLLEDSAEIGVSVQSSQFPVTDVEYALNDDPLPDVDDRIVLEAAELVPGPARLEVRVRSAGGQVETDSLEFEVASLPIRFEIEGLEEGDLLEDSAEIGVSVLSSQFPVTDVEYALNDVPLADVDDRISLRAAELVPGPARLDVRVRNAGGQVETDSLEFEVASLPIRFEIEGLEEGELLEDSAEIGVSVLSSQFPVTDVEYALNDVPLADVDDRISLRAAELVPGPARLDVRVRNAGGQVETASLEFEVARLSLEIELEDLPPGTSIDRDVDLGVAVSGQGSDFQLEVLLDGEPLVLAEDSIPLKILQLAPGEHNLIIRARDEFGNVGEESFNFSVSPGPAQTATQALAYREATQASIQRRATSAARSDASRVAESRPGQRDGRRAGHLYPGRRPANGHGRGGSHCIRPGDRNAGRHRGPGHCIRPLDRARPKKPRAYCGDDGGARYVDPGRRRATGDECSRSHRHTDRCGAKGHARRASHRSRPGNGHPGRRPAPGHGCGPIDGFCPKKPRASHGNPGCPRHVDPGR